MRFCSNKKIVDIYYIKCTNTRVHVLVRLPLKRDLSEGKAFLACLSLSLFYVNSCVYNISINKCLHVCVDWLHVYM